MTDYINVYQHRKEPLIEEGVIRHDLADAEMELAESGRDWFYRYTVEVDGMAVRYLDLTKAAGEIRREERAQSLSEWERDRVSAAAGGYR